MAPWKGPRHRSWASNTAVSGIALAFLLVCTLVSDYFGEPPVYLVGLLGTAAGAFFGAVGSDKKARDAEVAATANTANATANRAEAKADTLGRVAAQERPEVRQEMIPPFHGNEISGDSE